jgi:cytochrome c oxidase subunit 2
LPRDSVRLAPNRRSNRADLTHIGSRLTLGAGVVDNNSANIAGWIGNPQALKPGYGMPTQPLDADSLLAIAAYLSSLE